MWLVEFTVISPCSSFPRRRFKKFGLEFSPVPNSNIVSSILIPTWVSCKSAISFNLSSGFVTLIESCNLQISLTKTST